MTLAAALTSEIARRARCCEALSDPRNLLSITGTLDTIAACTGRIKALERLADVPAADRPAHATRLLCAALATPAHGTAAFARDAEMELYADVLRGHVTLT